MHSPMPHDLLAHDHDGGLAADLPALAAQMAQRRAALRWLAGGAAMALTGCGGGGDATAATTTTTTTTTTSSGGSTSSCSVIPEETAGPYPGDGSNNSGSALANALALTGIVRSDIRASIAGASGVAGGVPLTLVLKLVNTNGGCADLSGYAIYLWHCDREGRYSMYSSGVTSENYLRGVQATASDGSATFLTVFPGCYSGRMPHMHFEVYRNASAATAFANKLKTSQIAFPTDICATVYANASGYSASVANLNAISFASDNVFSDGVTTQLATLSGSVAAGYSATLTVGIAA
jgi:protocatechuate 3,4-dioxygenase beta subunit